MIEPRLITLHLLLDPAAERPEGEIEAPDGASVTFSGWLEFSSAVERMRRAAAPGRAARGT